MRLLAQAVWPAIRVPGSGEITTTGMIHSRVTLSANTTDSVTEERIFTLPFPAGC